MRIDDAFAVLGLSRETPLRDVRRRYHELIKALHPDSSGEEADRVAQVIEAYRCIREEGSRSRYHTHGAGMQTEYEGEPDRVTTRMIFTLGRWAATAPDRRVRLNAVRQLATSGLQSAAVFLLRSMLDEDREVASSAAEGFLECAGVSAEQSVLDILEQMTVSQRLVLLAAVEHSQRVMPRVFAWAQADPDQRVRRMASRLGFGRGRTA